MSMGGNSEDFQEWVELQGATPDETRRSEWWRVWTTAWAAAKKDSAERQAQGQAFKAAMLD